MSDGHSKAIPEAEPLDDIILGDDDDTSATDPPPPMPRPSSPPPILRPSGRPPDRASAPPPAPSVPPPGNELSSSNRMRAAGEKDSQGRKRAKMTLRIPDDEISRPGTGTPPQGIPIAPLDDGGARPRIRTMTGPPPSDVAIPVAEAPEERDYSADDTLELPTDQVRARTAAYVQAHADRLADEIEGQVAEEPIVEPMRAAPAVGIDPTQERGWTPYQPAVDAPSSPPPPQHVQHRPIDDDVDDAARTAVLPIQPQPILDVFPSSPPPAFHSRDGHEAHAGLPGNAGLPVGAGLERDPVIAAPPVDHVRAPISEEIPVELSDIPDTSSDEIATHPRLPTSLDSEEIRIDEVDRPSETGEVEIAVEDLVSVESLPSPANPGGYPPGHVPPPLKTAGKYPAFKEGGAPIAATPGPSATALMSGVAPTPSPSRPAMNAVSPRDAREAQPRPRMESGTDFTPPQPDVSPATHVAPVTGVAHGGYGAVPPGQPPAGYGAPPGAYGQAQPQPYPSPSAPTTNHRRDPSNPMIFVPPVGALAPPPMTDTVAHRKKTRPWWEELFNDDFIRTMAKVSDGQIGQEVTFIEESLGCEAGAMILDLACGTGRHAVELAARGYQVVGFDLSLAMLARASDEAQDRKQKINFVQGDMREMTFEETFDGIYSWNTSFGYFDEEKNAAVIARVHKALKKGGQFLLDVVNRDFIVRQAPSLAWFEGDGCICMDEMGIDFITSRMKVKRTLMMDDGRTKEIEYSVRIYALHELGKMLHDNGFRVAEVSGRTGTPGVFFGCESPRTLILAEKR